MCLEYLKLEIVIIVIDHCQHRIRIYKSNEGIGRLHISFDFVTNILIKLTLNK